MRRIGPRKGTETLVTFFDFAKIDEKNRSPKGDGNRILFYYNDTLHLGMRRIGPRKGTETGAWLDRC